MDPEKGWINDEWPSAFIVGTWNWSHSFAMVVEIYMSIDYAMKNMCHIHPHLIAIWRFE